MSSALNFTVTDQSPCFLYSPEREAWDSTHSTNNLASGTSSHTTTLSGASASLDFVGSAISIYGSATAGAYSTQLDGGAAVAGNPSGSLLASFSGLNGSAKHTITLRATQSQSLTLSYATFTVRSNAAPSSMSNTTTVAVTAGVNNTFTTDSMFSTSSNTNNYHEDNGYTRIDTNSAGASMSFSVSNTSALFVYGTTNWDHQTYSIELNPPAGASDGARIFNGTSKWFVLDNLVFFESGLDPTKTYNIKMTNLIDGSYSDIHSVVAMNLPVEENNGTGTSSGSVPDPTATSLPSKASTTAKTVGIAVGSVVVLAALLLFAFICYRRRAKKRRRHDESLPLDPSMMVTPFHDQQLMGSLSTVGAPVSPSEFKRTASHDDRYPYGSTYTSSTNSTRDLRALGVPYSQLSVHTDEFNPYSDAGSLRPPQSPFGIASGSGSASGSAAAATYSSGRREKTVRPGSEASSSSRLRQEVDAGRVPQPDNEETLPPTYDPTWADR
ncbi:hypothetical protein MKEN_00105100 [Mycena kentingensis (nom. inval.)]|nr:hypothetical protein MKEN_00105100 [Mycena kentingensis (nom. inval.)]